MLVHSIFSKRHYGFWSVLFLFGLNLSSPIMAIEDCEYATDLLYQAYDLYSQGRNLAQQKSLLEKALRNCAKHSEIHNALASVYEEQGDETKAIEHYKKALEQEDNFMEAWYGLGEIYFKQKRFSLSLEAYLHACSTDVESKARVNEILKNQRYAIAEKGEIIDKENLLILYDMERRQKINRMLSACRLYTRVQPKYIFQNLSFYVGKATLKPRTRAQLKEITAALQEIEPVLIRIHGHTDIQPLQDQNQEENYKYNQELSEKRAAKIAEVLTQFGIDITYIKTFGHGYSKPITYGVTPTALAKNRRIEIEVENLYPVP
jgi:chemotaxis protein MotB